MSELYYHTIYKGYNLFVESTPLEGSDYVLHEGVAQFNGTTYFTSKSLISGGSAEAGLKDRIDMEEDNDI